MMKINYGLCVKALSAIVCRATDRANFEVRVFPWKTTGS